MRQIRWIGLPRSPFGGWIIWSWRYSDGIMRYHAPYIYDHEGD